MSGSSYDFPFMKKQKSMDELQDDNERLKIEVENADLRLSKAQKDALYKQMDDAGLTLRKDFGGSLKRAWQWLNRTKK
jgi:hypothetical protein